MEKNKLSNEAIVTIALYTLSGGTRSFDLETIAKKADELAKVRFRWISDKDMICTASVRDALYNVRQKPKEYILQKSKKYLLTEKGLKFAEANLGKIKKFDQSKSRIRGLDKEIYENTKNRLISTQAYQKVKNNKENEINIKEANQFFRLNDYMTISQKKEKVQKIKNLFINDKEFKQVIDRIANQINQEVK
jgi:hypothetical protein|tara:strand:+ start:430 stop:1005 length:576 start_codon:yes stop_codon:yes gene_type:complete